MYFLVWNPRKKAPKKYPPLPVLISQVKLDCFFADVFKLANVHSFQDPICGLMIIRGLYILPNRLGKYHNPTREIHGNPMNQPGLQVQGQTSGAPGIFKDDFYVAYAHEADQIEKLMRNL